MTSETPYGTHKFRESSAKAPEYREQSSGTGPAPERKAPEADRHRGKEGGRGDVKPRKMHQAEPEQ